MPVASRARLYRGQPIDERRVEVDPGHWLARDLVFTHTGNVALTRDGPLRPSNVMQTRGRSAATAAGSPLNNTAHYIPDGSAFEDFRVDAFNIPYTLSVWQWGPAASTVDPLISIRRSLDTGTPGGCMLRRSAGESSQIVSVQDGNAEVVLTASAGAFVPDAWQMSTGVMAAVNDRRVFTDGVQRGTQTTQRSHSDCIGISILRGVTMVDVICTSTIKGVALPIVLNRALSDAEVTRLYEEQRTNPWQLFRERPRQIWLGAAAGFPTLSLPRAKAGSATPGGFVPQWTAG